jgi:fructokinase
MLPLTPAMFYAMYPGGKHCRGNNHVAVKPRQCPAKAGHCRGSKLHPIRLKVLMESMRKTVLSFGEVLWDLLPGGALLGGAPCNFAYRINSLGDKGVIVSRLGPDDLGKKALENILSLGLDASYLQRDEKHPTGTVRVSFDSSNNPDYIILPQVAYDYIELTPALSALASEADCLCFGTLSQRSRKSRETLREIIETAGKGLKLLDINLRKDCYDADTVCYSLGKADMLKLNENEAAELSGILGFKPGTIPEFCDKAAEKYLLKACVVTLGERGAFALSDRGEKVYDPGYKVELADPVGAGDAFSAGFLHGILHGFAPARACGLGNILGALVASKKGAAAPVTRDEIEEFSRKKTGRIRDPLFSKYAVC